jgi:hypothetical protein
MGAVLFFIVIVQLFLLSPSLVPVVLRSTEFTRLLLSFRRMYGNCF